MFNDLEPFLRERLFAPCCLSREQLWNQGVDWSGEKIDEAVIGPAFRRLSQVRGESKTSMIQRLEYSSARGLIEDTLLEGDDFAVEFLAWYLEDTLDSVGCETETSNNEQEPDLTITRNGVHACDVELKRVVSTSNLLSYAKEFAEKDWQRYEPSHPSILLLVFPLLSVEPWRVQTLTQGYVDFCTQVENWYDEAMKAYVVTAPLDIAEDSDDLPLRVVSQLVDDVVS